MKTPRQLVLEALQSVTQSSAYSNIVLNNLVNTQLKKENVAFATTLFYGVIERMITIDYIINYYSNKKTSKLDNVVLNILRCGIYQLLYMDNVPDSAACNESVLLTAFARKTSAKGFVNAILRNFIRDNKEINFSDIKDDKYLVTSIKYSYPVWIVKLLATQYSFDEMCLILENQLKPPKTYLKVNTLKITDNDLINMLKKENVLAKKDERIDNCIYLTRGTNVASLQSYKNGYFHVQDISSQLCALTVDAKEGETILDLCAAPGGKTFSLAQRMNNKGKIVALDIYPNKLNLIRENSARLGINIIKVGVNDASIFNESIKKADKVLCDSVCSGLGIINRKPEIKLKQEGFINELPLIQLSILSNAAKYVKDGGYLIYSTCTINKMENEEVCNEFLKNNDDFCIEKLSFKSFDIEDEKYVTLLPHINNTDGFFIAKFKKSKGK